MGTVFDDILSVLSQILEYATIFQVMVDMVLAFFE